MWLRRELVVILYVFIFLLNDPQLMRACEVDTREEIFSGHIYGSEDILTMASKSNVSGIFHLRYSLSGGKNSSYNPKLLRQEQLPLVLSVPEREGYNFAGWYTDSSYRNKITVINEKNAASMVLFAKWTKIIDNRYNVERYSYRTSRGEGQREKELKACSYSFLDHVEIPGMPSTRERDYLDNIINSEAQCLQGLCFTQEFILMTAYSEDSGKQGSLMIFDRESGRYMMSLDMKLGSHLGGIAFDGENVWICHSGENTLERIPYRYILEATVGTANEKSEVSVVSTEYALNNRPSCITCYDGKIWVATHTTFWESEMVAYCYGSSTDCLSVQGSYRIPSKVQGIAFDPKGEVYLSTSYGRNNSSYLMLYDSLTALNQKPQEAAVKVEMPPCSEEIAIMEGKIYVVFESASMKYFEGTDGKGTCNSPIDKLLEVSIASLW